MLRAAKTFLVLLAALLLVGARSLAEQRFPPPDFAGGYHLPATSTPPANAGWRQNLDTAVLGATLLLGVWLIHGRRSRRSVLWLSIFSLAYFGFYRKGCICPIGSTQNIATALAQPDYAVPVVAVVFFALPLATALFFGRVFCAGVCPQGALQDLFLIKPIKIPGWLEHGLGLVPYMFLGAGVAVAATGTGFIICRYDPFVPVFRLSGGLFILGAGATFLGLSTFVGRPYCRFLCPYGALLKAAALAAKWPVGVTPDTCTQCRLCQNSCPFGAMREPMEATQGSAPEERRALGRLLLLLPILVAAGSVAGAALAPAAARLHPTVRLADQYAGWQSQPRDLAPKTPQDLALERAARDPETVLTAAADWRRRFRMAMALFGAWAGLVVGLKLVSLTLRPERSDFEPDRGACLACARCFSDCPAARARLGLTVLSAPA